jgi:hypothetical protein
MIIIKRRENMEKPILKFMDSDLNFSEMENKINKREGSLLLF